MLLLPPLFLLLLRLLLLLLLSRRLLFARPPDLNLGLHVLHVQLANVEEAGEVLAIADGFFVIRRPGPDISIVQATSQAVPVGKQIK